MTAMILRLSFAIAAVLLPTSASAFVLDAMSDPFPPNPCLPNTGAPVIFVGSYCDGTTCPPDPVAACEQGFATQTGLAGVHGGAFRSIDVDWDSGPTDVSARVRDDLHRMDVASAGSHSHLVRLQYGDQSAPMNLDLNALGMTQLVMEFGGDLSSGLPLQCNVQMYTNAEPFYSAGGELTLNVTQPGPVSLPFSQFQTIPGFSFADVDFVLIQVGECPGGVCEAPATARAYTIGPIHMEPGVVANRGQTWGRLKALYR